MAFVLDDRTRDMLSELCRKYAVKRLLLFGSATAEDFDPARSDLDFLVEFEPPPPEMRPARQFFGLQEELQALFGREVDVLEESAIDNPYLKRNACAGAVVLYAA